MENRYKNKEKISKGVADMIDVQFTSTEKELLKKYGISFTDSMEYEEAESVLDISDYMQEMDDREVYIAEDIIDKITTHPNW